MGLGRWPAHGRRISTQVQMFLWDYSDPCQTFPTLPADLAVDSYFLVRHQMRAVWNSEDAASVSKASLGSIHVCRADPNGRFLSTDAAFRRRARQFMCRADPNRPTIHVSGRFLSTDARGIRQRESPRCPPAGPFTAGPAVPAGGQGWRAFSP